MKYLIKLKATGGKMTDREKIDDYFKKHKDEMLGDLKALIKIPSVKKEALLGMPFGEETAMALDVALDIAKRKGLEVKNFDNYVGTVNLNDADTNLGILAHLDVMPEGSGWSYPAFDMTYMEDKIYGRGTADDKGPAVAALYAMSAAKEICPDLKNNARLILGTDEECGSSDIAYYFTKEEAPAHVFSPDSDFPVLNVEKGRMATSFGKKWEDQTLKVLTEDKPPADGLVSGLRVMTLRGGVRNNAVPDKAECMIQGVAASPARSLAEEAGSVFSASSLDDLIKEISVRTGITFSYELLKNNFYHITTMGVNAHGSTPEAGNNALTGLLELLNSMPLSACEVTQAIKGLCTMFPHGDTRGEALGIECQDEESGALTLNFGILDLDPVSFTAQIDLRSPVTADQKFIISRLREALLTFGAKIINEAIVPPHVVPEDDPFVQTLLKIYHEYTGKEAYCTSTGGGTYVHDIEGGVGFGCTMPGVDNHMHGADEFAIVDDLILSAKMFTQAILDICG